MRLRGLIQVQHFKRLTSQQLGLSASGALVTGSVMLSHDSWLGFALLSLAMACGFAALFRSARR